MINGYRLQLYPNPLTKKEFIERIQYQDLGIIRVWRILMKFDFISQNQHNKSESTFPSLWIILKEISTLFS